MRDSSLKSYKVICPLINFEISNVLTEHSGSPKEETFKRLRDREGELKEGIDLIEGIRIRRVSAEDIRDLIQVDYYVPLHARFSLNMFVVEKTLSAEQPHSFELDKLIRNVVLALRLLKVGYVSGNYIFYIRLSGEHQLEGWSSEERTRAWSPGDKYALRFEEAPALEKLLRKLQGVDLVARKSFGLACKRFERAYEEEDLDDQLIDLMIALEALFLKGVTARSSHGEMIAIACSNLLGRDSSERDKIRKLLTKAYSVRNRIVHGSEYLEPFIPKVLDIGEMNYTIEGYVRESIKRFLD